MSGELMYDGELEDATVCERIESNQLIETDERVRVDYELLLRSRLPTDPVTRYRCRIYTHLLRDRFEPPLKYATQILQIPNTDECNPSCEIPDAEGTYN
jgi:hypothetical protein